MNGKALIISQSRNKTAEYAVNSLGLKRGEFEHVATVSQVRNARRGEIHLAPSWDKHPQRFAIATALRFTRPGVDVILHAPIEEPISNVQWDGELTAEEREVLNSVLAQEIREVLHRMGADIEESLEASSEKENDEQAGETVEGEGSEETAEQQQNRRRRRRCKDCNILVDPDDVEEHAASHEQGE